MIAKTTVQNIAYESEISAIGITVAAPLFDILTLIRKHPEYTIRFQNESEIENKNNPLSVLPSARSVIVAFQPYPVIEIEKIPPLYGLLAPFARSNYYKELRKKLEKMAKELKKRYGGDYYISINGNKLFEKPLAVKSGLGFYGKNSLVINEKFGSYGVLGCLVTSLEIEQDSPSQLTCGKCEICKNACPSGGIDGSGVMFASKCLQHICQQDHIADEYILLMKQTLYGCNICQDVCPFNKRAEKRHELSIYGYLGEALYLPDIIYLSDREWREKFKGYQLGANWLSPIAIIKNALIAIANSNSSDSILILKEFIGKGRPELKLLAEKLVETSVIVTSKINAHLT